MSNNVHTKFGTKRHENINEFKIEILHNTYEEKMVPLLSIHVYMLMSIY